MVQTKTVYIGLGYVGGPEALLRAYTIDKKNSEGETIDELVLGFDIDEEKVLKFNRGQNPFPNDQWVQGIIDDGASIHASITPDILEGAQNYVISLPTPATKEGEEEYPYIRKGLELIAKYLKKDDLVVLQSTMGPGVTERFVKPTLQKYLDSIGSDLKVDEYIHVVVAPETINPGDTEHTPDTLTRVIGASTEIAKKRGYEFFKVVFPDNQIYEAKGTAEAEGSKCITNVSRFILCGISNEYVKGFAAMGLDGIDIIRAAQKKGFGATILDPGPGIGGHCLGPDTELFNAEMKKYGIDSPIAQAALLVNGSMPRYTAGIVSEVLNEVGLPVNGSTITVLGFAYKRNIGDSRETPIDPLVRELIRLHGIVRIYDPLIEHKLGDLESLRVFSEEEAFKGSDVVVLATAHNILVEGLLAKIGDYKIKAVVDAQNVLMLDNTDDLGFFYKGLGRQ